jgi:hypothetical protein
MRNQELRRLSGRLASLMQIVPLVRDPLDYLVGAIYALLKAEELQYDDRHVALPDDYWQFPIKRAKQMAETGTTRAEGKWLAGFYFNSAILRIAASYHRVLVLLTNQRAYVDTLLRKIERTYRFRHTNLSRVHKEVNLIKHDAVALRGGRKVTFDVAIAAIEELIDLVDARQVDC